MTNEEIITLMDEEDRDRFRVIRQFRVPTKMEERLARKLAEVRKDNETLRLLLDGANAQVAALREPAERLLRHYIGGRDGVPPPKVTVWGRLKAAVTDTAAVAREHDERLREEGRGQVAQLLCVGCAATGKPIRSKDARWMHYMRGGVAYCAVERLWDADADAIRRGE